MTDTPKESPAARGTKTPKERFIEAAGVTKEGDPQLQLLQAERHMKDAVTGMVAAALKAGSAAKETQQETRDLFQKLRNYCSTTLPDELKKALESMGKESLQPLRDEVRETVTELKEQRATAESEWGFRLVLVAMLCSLLVAAIAFVVLYHYFFSERYDEIKRYAEWGRKVEAEFQKLPPKDRQRVFGYYGRP